MGTHPAVSTVAPERGQVGQEFGASLNIILRFFFVFF
jgi:hypothetical protein